MPGSTAFLCTVFFLSGASALIFETLWFRLSGLTFGNSVWASALVLSSFMGGLALGNGLAAYYGDRIRHPVRLYAFMEITVAITGVLLIFIIPILTEKLSPLFRQFLDTPWILNPLRLSISFLLMLVPATAMGITLPVLVKALFAESSNFGQALGKLYGWNTLGAMAGALSGEIFLIKLFGIRGTAFFAAFLNLSVATGVLILSSRFQVEKSEPQREAKPVFGWSISSLKEARLLVAGFLSGGILLALEVVWFRFLQLFVTSTTVVFAFMLSVVLMGIGLGGILASFLSRLRLKASLSLIAMLSGATSVILYMAFNPAIAENSTNLLAHKWFDVFSLTFSMAFPVSLLSGILFTVIGDALHEEIGEEIKATGLLTMANTVGAMLGPIVAGFFLLPVVGMEFSFFLLSLSYGVVALITFDFRQVFRTRKSAMVAGGAVLIFSFLLWRFPFGLMKDYFQLATERFNNKYHQWKCVATHEGLTETIQYLQTDYLGEPLAYRLVTNGFAMASTETYYQRYTKYFVYFPIAVHPNPKRALLISFGTGLTAKALTDSRQLNSIDIVDISKDVLQMSYVVFPDPSDNPKNDPRVNVHIEDGRFFLQTTGEKFDVITAEPPPPKAHGIVNLYTQEYFQLIYDRLAEGGITTYWLPVHHLKEEEAKSILKAFCNVFDDCSLWMGAQLSWMMVGSRDAIGPVTTEYFSRQWADPKVGPELRALGFETPEQMGSLLLFDTEQIRELTKNSLPLVDNYPKRLSDTYIYDSKLLQGYTRYMNADSSKEGFISSPMIQRLWPKDLQKASLNYFEFRNEVNRFPRWASYQSNMSDLHHLLTKSSLREPVLWLLGSSEDQQRIVDKIVGQKKEVIDEINYQLAARALADRDYVLADTYLSKIAPENMKEMDIIPLRIYLLCMSGEIEKAKKFMAGYLKTDGFSNESVRWVAYTFGLLR